MFFGHCELYRLRHEECAHFSFCAASAFTSKRTASWLFSMKTTTARSKPKPSANVVKSQNTMAIILPLGPPRLVAHEIPSKTYLAFLIFLAIWLGNDHLRVCSFIIIFILKLIFFSFLIVWTKLIFDCSWFWKNVFFGRCELHRLRREECAHFAFCAANAIVGGLWFCLKINDFAFARPVTPVQNVGALPFYCGIVISVTPPMPQAVSLKLGTTSFTTQGKAQKNSEVLWPRPAAWDIPTKPFSLFWMVISVGNVFLRVCICTTIFTLKLIFLSEVDPLLVCSAYKKNRFYIFSRREPVENPELQTGRDVWNEKPSKEDMALANTIAGIFGLKNIKNHQKYMKKWRFDLF